MATFNDRWRGLDELGADIGMPVDDGPADRAAARTRRSVRPVGARREGKATRIAETTGTALGRLGTGIIDSAVRGVMAPGNAYRSTPDDPVTTEQMIGPAVDLAGLIMGGTGFGAPVGAIGAGPVGRFTRTTDFVGEADRSGRAKRYVDYEAPAGAHTLRADMAIDGDTAHVNFFGLIRNNGDLVPVDQARGEVGPAQIRRLIEQVRDEHPNVMRVVADRVSGARMGGRYDPAATGPATSFELRLPARSVSDPFTDGLDDWFYGR